MKTEKTALDYLESDLESVCKRYLAGKCSASDVVATAQRYEFARLKNLPIRKRISDIINNERATVKLNGSAARIVGFACRFLSVYCPKSGQSVEFADATVLEILSNGGEFRS